MLEMQKIEPAARLGQFMRLFEDVEAEFIGLAIDALILRLDERDGDADLEPTGDEADAAWPEYAGGRGGLMRSPHHEEDAEDDDPAEHDDEPEDDDPRELTAQEDMQYWHRPAVGTDDDEPDNEDCCSAGDDEVRSGTGPLNRGHFLHMDHITIGNEDDEERNTPPSYFIDQSAALNVEADNDV